MTSKFSFSTHLRFSKKFKFSKKNRKLNGNGGEPTPRPRHCLSRCRTWKGKLTLSLSLSQIPTIKTNTKIQVYSKNVKIENVSNVPIDFTILGSKKYQIEPEMIPVLKPGDSIEIKITLRVPSSTKTMKRMNKDTFSIRSKFFVQRFPLGISKPSKKRNRQSSMTQHQYLVQNVSLGERNSCLNWIVQTKS